MLKYEGCDGNTYKQQVDNDVKQSLKFCLPFLFKTDVPCRQFAVSVTDGSLVYRNELQHRCRLIETGNGLPIKGLHSI